jgi:hypothetical protein
MEANRQLILGNLAAMLGVAKVNQANIRIKEVRPNRFAQGQAGAGQGHSVNIHAFLHCAGSSIAARPDTGPDASPQRCAPGPAAFIR